MSAMMDMGKQVVTGVVPPQFGEAKIRTVWPSVTAAMPPAATLGRLLAAEMIPFALLTGATPVPRRREAVERLATGELGLAVGTHALIEPAVRFARLGVCIPGGRDRIAVGHAASVRPAERRPAGVRLRCEDQRRGGRRDPEKTAS